MTVLFRLILLVLVAGSGMWLWRSVGARVRMRRALPSLPKRLGKSELDLLGALAKSDAHLADGMRARGEMLPLLSGDDVADVAIAVDEGVRQLAKQVELFRRIQLALADASESELAQARASLVRRRDALAQSLEDGVVELKQMKLALLDAAAGPGGVAAGRAVVDERLAAAKQRVVDVNAAHDEIDATLRRQK